MIHYAALMATAANSRGLTTEARRRMPLWRLSSARPCARIAQPWQRVNRGSCVAGACGVRVFPPPCLPAQALALYYSCGECKGGAWPMVTVFLVFSSPHPHMRIYDLTAPVLGVDSISRRSLTSSVWGFDSNGRQSLTPYTVELDSIHRRGLTRSAFGV